MKTHSGPPRPCAVEFMRMHVGSYNPGIVTVAVINKSHIPQGRINSCYAYKAEYQNNFGSQLAEFLCFLLHYHTRLGTTLIKRCTLSELVCILSGSELHISV